MRFSLLLAGIGFALAQTHCTSPHAWEAEIFYFDPVQHVGVRGSFHYDAINLRRAVHELRFDPVTNASQHLHVFALWRTPSGPTMYSFNLNTSQCFRAPINFDWRDYGVNPNATFRRQVTYGTEALPGAGVFVNQYFHLDLDNNNTARGAWESEFTRIACLPYRHFYINLTQAVHDFREDHWYSTTLGIRDPAVFNPPPQCSSELVLESKVPVTEDPRTWSMASLHDRSWEPAATPKASAANPTPCVSPPTWDARTSYYDPLTMLRVESELSYDGANQREYAYEVRHEALSTGDARHVQVWALWKATPPRLFMFDLNTSVCTSAPLTRPWRPVGVNPNATYDRTQIIGTNAFELGGVEINTFVHRVNDPRGAPATISYNQVTAVGCIPVREVYLNFTGGTPQHPFDYAERHVTNVVPGFSDPLRFEPPSACRFAVQVAAPAHWL